jgi:hypothetical protein
MMSMIGLAFLPRGSFLKVSTQRCVGKGREYVEGDRN